MLHLQNHEALLFRLLVRFFGEDRVIPHMSALAVCGGVLPDRIEHTVRLAGELQTRADWASWAKRQKCLFAVVNHQDAACMVVEFAQDLSDIIDVQALERRRSLAPILSAAGIHYVTISAEEFSELTDPSGDLDFCALLKSKIPGTEEEMPQL